MVIRACLLCVTLAASMPVLAGSQGSAERFTHFAGVRLADTPSLENIQSILGKSQVIRTGDAADYDARLCYRSAHGDVVVEFFHGEVDWGYVMRRRTGHDSNCPISAELEASKLSVAGIRLGITRGEYERVVGETRKVAPNRLESDFRYTHVLSNKELAGMVRRDRKNGYGVENPEDMRRWDVGIHLTGMFRGGRLVSFTVERTETN